MESFLTLTAKGFLLFSHPILIVPLIVMGFLVDGKCLRNTPSPERLTLWGHICLLVLFTMIFNALLKSIFLIPLNPSLGKEGYAFPSGHMQVSVVFYGALFMVYSHHLGRAILILILMGIGYGLIQQGYHSLIDVVASVAVGVGTLYSYKKLISRSIFEKHPAYFGLLLIPIAGIMAGIIAYRTGIPPHTSGAFIGLLFIAVTWLFYARHSTKSAAF